MMCFKDKTFCSSDCVNTACDRNVTDQVRADALAWTQSFAKLDYPLMMWADLSARCGEYKAPTTTEGDEEWSSI